MTGYCVVVAGGSTARFFTLEPTGLPELESGPNLVEQEVLLNPDNAVHDGELWSDTKSGRNRAAGGEAHGYDDHRERHHDELSRRFAHEVMERAAELARAHADDRLLLVAERQMLGLLRGELGPLAKLGVAIQDHPRELTRLTPFELHDHLTREGLLPARRRPLH